MSQKNRAEEQARSHAQRLSDARSRLAPLGAEYSIRGLTTEELNQRVELGLVNNYRQASSRSIGAILRANLITLFNMVVGGAFLILLALGQWRDALFGIAVVSNILIGTIQEFRAKRTLDKLSLLHQPKAHVIRDGLEVEIAAHEIALDDLLILRTGDQALADGTVLESDSLEIDESMLTGEPIPVAKSAGAPVVAGSLSVDGVFTVARREAAPEARVRAVDRLRSWGSTAFYDAVLAPLGASRLAEFPGVVGFEKIAAVESVHGLAVAAELAAQAQLDKAIMAQA